MAKKKTNAGASKLPAAKVKKRRLGKRATKAEKQAVRSERGKISPAYSLFWKSLEILWQHKKLLGGILLVYGVLDLLLVGAGVGNIGAARSTLGQVSHGQVDKISGGVSLFSFLINSSSGSTAGAAAGAYQTMLILLVSVVFIWALRQVYANHPARVREAYYVGTYPIVPFVLVMLVIGLQLLPLVAGGAIYRTLVGGNIAIGAEQFIALAIFFALAVWSLYMVCASIFALYVVTLPDMTPLKALRSAKELVKFRRLSVLLKLLFLPLAMLLSVAVIEFPVALLAAPLATILFFALTVLAVGVAHSYMYALYRELI